MNHQFDIYKEPDGQPVEIEFDETSQFAEGSVNVSVTTFLSGLQKLPKIGRPPDIRFTLYNVCAVPWGA